MGSVSQVLRFSGIDFGIFWDFPQDGLRGFSVPRPVLILFLCCSEPTVRHTELSTVIGSVKRSLHRRVNRVVEQLARPARRSARFPRFRHDP